MAIRAPGGDQPTPPTDKVPQDKDKPSSRSARGNNRTAQRPQPKPGIHAEEEHEIDHHQQQLQRIAEQQKVQEVQLKAKPAPVDELNKQLRENRERENRNMGGGSAGGGQNSRADQARTKGFQNTPAVSDFVKGQAEPKAGSSFAELLPTARARGPSLPEPEMRPPIFLSTFEGMKDIYLRLKGRASNKTRELLEGPALEDLVKAVVAIQEDEVKVKASDARVFGPLYTKLKADPGPLLLGLNDPRLHEPWRLFLEGWDVWVPDKAVDKAQSGIELFIEGEGEDDAGEPIEIIQMLRMIGAEITLETKLGPLKDRLSYDGERFYRLKSDAS